MSDKIDVLDHGFVRLIDSMGTDLSVARAARVSYDAAWRAGVDAGSDAKLINYLWKNKHTSPFESVTFTFEVKAPIFVFRQWHRHRTWSYSELSARYRELPEEFYVPQPRHIGTQSKDNKQARILPGVTDEILDRYEAGEETLDEHNLVVGLLPAIKSAVAIDDICRAAFNGYKQLLENGVPREVARSVLPVATYSHMFATVDLLNLLKFFSLRSHDHAQYEIRVFSDAMRELVKPIVPVCIGAWEATNV